MMEQPTKLKTRTANIFKETLQALATVYNRLLGAEQGKLCSPDVIKAAMLELTYLTCFLNDNLQKCKNQLDCSSSLKWGGEDNYTTHSSSKNPKITSPLYNSDSIYMTSSPVTKAD